ncbi:hypothetical protein EBZ38_11825 [bacterium]|nr:hypothetical protein [bacterium]NDD84942.1 hypothetical protein [bacterium]
MKKQTAVEWLVEQVNTDCLNSTFIRPELIEKAKSIEREQILEAFDEGQEYEYQYHINSTPKFDSQTYYNETYNDNK